MRLYVPNFLGGMNTASSPLQTEINQCSFLENLYIPPPSAGVYNYDSTVWDMDLLRNVLSSRHTYKDLSQAFSLLNSVGDVVTWNPPSGANYNQPKQFIIGYDLTGLVYRCYRSVDPAIAPVEIWNAAAASPGSAARGWIQPFGEYLYTSDGYSLDTRRIDNTYAFITLGAGVQPKCLYAASHKNRFVLANEAVNNVRNMVWFSDVGNAESFPATQYIEVGDKNEPVTGLYDQYDRLIVFKERSVWAIYLAPNIVDSQVVPIDKNYGIFNNKCFVSTPYGLYMYNPIHGVMVLRNVVEVVNTPISNLFTDTKATNIADSVWTTPVGAIGYYAGQVYLSNIRDYLDNAGLGQANITYIIDIQTNKCFRLKNPFISFYSKVPSNSFNGKPLAFSGTKILQIDPQDGSSSPISLDATLFWGYQAFGAPERIKSLNHIVVTFMSNAVTNLTVESWVDGVMKQQIVKPVALGMNSIKVSFNPNTSKGKFIGIKMTCSITTSDIRSAFIDMSVDYTLENAVI